MSIVFDIAVVAIVALLVFLGFHRGFVRTVFNLDWIHSGGGPRFLYQFSDISLDFSDLFQKQSSRSDQR